MTRAVENARAMPPALETAALALLFGLLSMIPSGFEFGVSNNVFHIPYVLDLAASAEFSGDALYRSLENFTSAVWPLLRLFSNEENVRTVFFVAHVLSRSAAFAAILLLLQSFGVTRRPALLTCLAVIAVTPWLQGLSAVGGHGLFLSYFTHTEVTWAPLLLALLFLERDKPVLAAALAGLVFSINAFVGIWLLFIGAMLVLLRGMKMRPLRLLQAAAAFLLFALPVAIWIGLSIRGVENAAPFSYIEYIRAYYPAHFLIEAAPKTALLRLILLFACGLLASFHLPRSRFWIQVQLACLLLLIGGSLLPYLFDQRFIFNMHFLRAAGVEQLLSILLISAASIRLLVEQHVARSACGMLLLILLLGGSAQHTADLVFMAAVLLASLSLMRQGGMPQILNRVLENVAALPLLFIAWATLKLVLGTQFWPLVVQTALAGTWFFFSRRQAHDKRPMLIGLIPGLSILVCTSAIAQERLHKEALETAETVQWMAFTDKIHHSDLHGTFLLPLRTHEDTFQLLARRPVWVDYKQGAAVMWAPSFHEQWMQRHADLLRIGTAEKMRDYARSHDIPYFIVVDGTCPPLSSQRLAVARYAVCSST